MSIGRRLHLAVCTVFAICVFVTYGCGSSGDGEESNDGESRCGDYGAKEYDPSFDRLPWHFVNIWWYWGEMPDFHRLDIDVEVTDVSKQFKLYISPIN